jgi:hypothetical protein
MVLEFVVVVFCDCWTVGNVVCSYCVHVIRTLLWVNVNCCHNAEQWRCTF